MISVHMYAFFWRRRIFIYEHAKCDWKFFEHKEIENSIFSVYIFHILPFFFFLTFCFGNNFEEVGNGNFTHISCENRCFNFFPHYWFRIWSWKQPFSQNVSILCYFHFSLYIFSRNFLFSCYSNKKSLERLYNFKILWFL